MSAILKEAVEFGKKLIYTFYRGVDSGFAGRNSFHFFIQNFNTEAMVAYL
jgi:hypothetical protein